MYGAAARNAGYPSGSQRSAVIGLSWATFVCYSITFGIAAELERWDGLCGTWRRLPPTLPCGCSAGFQAVRVASAASQAVAWASQQPARRAGPAGASVLSCAAGRKKWRGQLGQQDPPPTTHTHSSSAHVPMHAGATCTGCREGWKPASADAGGGEEFAAAAAFHAREKAAAEAAARGERPHLEP